MEEVREEGGESEVHWNWYGAHVEEPLPGSHLVATVDLDL